MKTFTLEDNEALFIIDQIGGLPNKSGTAPLFAKLADQYNAQVQTSAPADNTQTSAPSDTPLQE